MSLTVTILTFAAALGSGTMAGVLFIFSVCIMAALARLPDDHGIEAMQSINATILNAWFFAAFFGTAAPSLALIALAALDWDSPGAAWAMAGGLLYLVGAIAVTMIVNVPMNNALMAVSPTSAEGANYWRRYAKDWTAWNHVRTVAALAATACFIQALRAGAS